MSNYRKLYRSTKNKILGGICGGLGEYTNVDPVIFRLLFILCTLFLGGGILLYLILLIVVPSDKNEKLEDEKREKNMTPENSAEQFKENINNVANEVSNNIKDLSKEVNLSKKMAYFIFGALLIFLGFIGILSKIFNFNWSAFWFPLALMFVGIFILIISMNKKTTKL